MIRKVVKQKKKTKKTMDNTNKLEYLRFPPHLRKIKIEYIKKKWVNASKEPRKRKVKKPKKSQIKPLKNKKLSSWSDLGVKEESE